MKLVFLIFCFAVCTVTVVLYSILVSGDSGVYFQGDKKVVDMRMKESKPGLGEFMLGASGILVFFLVGTDHTLWEFKIVN